MLSRSVNGTNLSKYTDVIRAAHSDSPIIAVDACLSPTKNHCDVLVRGGGVNPKKALTEIENRTGDVGILGVLDSEGNNPLSALMSVSIDKVEKIAYKIAFVIHRTLSDIPYCQSTVYNIFS